MLQFVLPADSINAAIHWREYGTSRWQLMIERYTNNPCIRKRRVMAVLWPDSEAPAPVQ